MEEKLFVLKRMVQAAFGYSATLVLAAVWFLSGPPVNAECPDEPPEPPYRLFVKPEATGDASGQDWANAAVLQDALDCAASASMDTEIWVMAGTYVPSPMCNGDRALSFTIWTDAGAPEHRIEIYGGFLDGDDELGDRDFRQNPTILSGDTVHRDDAACDAVGIALDTVNGKIYWTDDVRQTVNRWNLDGSLDANDGVVIQLPRTSQDLGGQAQDTPSKPERIALDLESMEGGQPAYRVYWIEYGSGLIKWAYLDDLPDQNGESIHTLQLELETPLGHLCGEDRQASTGPFGLALDLDHGKIYWSTNHDGGEERPQGIYRCNLDGTDDGSNRPLVAVQTYDIALDLVSTPNKIYWTQSGVGIGRANLDGSAPEPGYIDTDAAKLAFALALDVQDPDPDERWAYFASRVGELWRTRLNAPDASQQLGVVIGNPQLTGLALIRATGSMFWTENWGYRLQRADMDDGSNMTTLLEVDCAGAFGDNVYHVLTSVDNDASVVLDGFTIRSGNAEGAGADEDIGAGMLITNGPDVDGGPIVRNCVFERNTAAGSGAGVHVAAGTAQEPVTFVNCLFEANVSNDAGAGGGGLCVSPGSRAGLINCTLGANTAPAGQGGGIYIDAGDVELRNCILWGNDDSGSGDEFAPPSSTSPREGRPTWRIPASRTVIRRTRRSFRERQTSTTIHGSRAARPANGPAQRRSNSPRTTNKRWCGRSSLPPTRRTRPCGRSESWTASSSAPTPRRPPCWRSTTTTRDRSLFGRSSRA